MWQKFNNYTDTRNKGTKISFSLSSDANTSAGIYDSSGNLISTLWSGKDYKKGNNTVYIKNEDDFGNLLSDGTYVVKILANYGLTYEWLGVIGNSTDVFTNNYMGGNYTFLQDLTISGTDVFYAIGYAEGRNPIRKSSTTDFNYIEDFGKKLTVYPNLFCIENDGTYVYGGFNTSLGDSDSTIVSGVCGFAISDGSEKSFTSGASYANLTYAVGVDSVATATDTGIYINDIAVSSSYIYAAKSNGLQILNKTTGALVSTNSVIGTLIKAYDSYLWVIHDSVCEKYTINSDGSITTTGTTISVTSPVGLTVDTSGNPIIADENYVNIYSGTTLSVTIGNSTQLTSTALVTNDRFDFSLKTANYKKIGLVLYNSNLYICDTGNGRLQVFDLSGNYVSSSISFLGNTYCSSVDIATNKIYHLDKEFTIDYTNQTWTLSRNWGLLIDKTGFDTLFGSAFYYIRTLSNSKLYAFVKTEANTMYVFELTDTTARKTSVTLDSNLWRLQNDGVTFLRYGYSTATVGTVKTYPVYKITITGFDSNNDPILSSQSVLYSVDSDIDYGDFPYGYPTLVDDDVLLFAEQSTSNSTIAGRYHLGLLTATNTYKWKTKLTTWKLASTSNIYDAYLGVYPKNRHDIGNVVQEQGSNIFVIDDTTKSCIDAYRNEYWKANIGFGQLNIFTHYDLETGLMIGQFGGSPISFDTSDVGLKGNAGNVFKNETVKVDGAYYMFTNDEGSGSGTHWWKISNITDYEILDDIDVTISASNGMLLETSSYSDLNFTGSNEYVSTINSFNSSASSVRFTGYILPSYSESYSFTPVTSVTVNIKIWVYSNLGVPTLVYDNVNSINTTIDLISGNKHKIIIELTSVVTGMDFSLQWSSTSQTIQNIPDTKIYKTTQIISDSGSELLKGLKPFQAYSSTTNATTFGYGMDASYSGTIGDNISAFGRLKEVDEEFMDIFYQINWYGGSGYAFKKTIPTSSENWILYGNYYLMGKADASSLNIYNASDEIIAKIWIGASAYDFITGVYNGTYKEGIALNVTTNYVSNIVADETSYTINPKWNPKDFPILSVLCKNKTITAQIGQYVVSSTALVDDTNISYIKYENITDNKINIYLVMKNLRIINL